MKHEYISFKVGRVNHLPLIFWSLESKHEHLYYMHCYIRPYNSIGPVAVMYNFPLKLSGML